MENEIKVFRIVEDIKGFHIEKKREIEVSNGYAFWLKPKIEVVWRDVDEEGYVIIWFLGAEKKEVKYYKTIDLAIKAIDKFKKFPIYHYELQKSSYPEFPKDEPTNI